MDRQTVSLTMDERLQIIDAVKQATRYLNIVMALIPAFPDIEDDPDLNATLEAMEEDTALFD